jgi:hypothetical protein
VREGMAYFGDLWTTTVRLFLDSADNVTEHKMPVARVLIAIDRRSAQETDGTWKAGYTVPTE